MAEQTTPAIPSFPTPRSNNGVTPIDLRKRPRLNKSIIQGFLLFSGALSIFTTIGIVFFLGEEAIQFFRSPDVTLLEFLTGTKWQPHLGEFGVIPFLNATLVTSFIAMLVAIPLGMCVAIYLSEYASPKTRGTIKPILEVIAGIPTVVLGFFALNFMTPLLRGVFGNRCCVDL